MKKLVLAALLATAMPVAAHAADIAVIIPPPPAPVYVPPPAPPGWAGPYVGIHAGYGFGTEFDNASEVAFIAGDEFPVRGFLAGIHAGFNVQHDNLVFGIEGDFDYAWIKGSIDYPGLQGGVGTLYFRTDLQASIRGRVGVVIGSDTLAYVTAGIAFARGTFTDIFENDVEDARTDTQWHRGFTFGGGIEHKFNDDLSARLEIRHSRFGTEEYDLDYVGGPVEVNFNQTTLTAGITFHF